MAKITSSSSSQESFSKRHFHWTNKVSNESEQEQQQQQQKEEQHEEDDQIHPNNQKETKPIISHDQIPKHHNNQPSQSQRRKIKSLAISRLRSVFLNAFAKTRQLNPGLGNRVVGTLFGHKRGHVHFAFQKDANSPPAFLVELATPISGLVKEMASGLVRIALECNKKEPGLVSEEESGAAAAIGKRLLEEPRWRTYCNGKRCGFATKKECGPREWKLLKAVEPISMGAGVLPKMKEDGDDDRGGDGEDNGEGEIMYMRAKFERVVGSRDSEAFYMMNPDSNVAPELSIYLLRV
ncbi:protein MIZU-KUSSEI 1 [Impatiens glandulifera]|uniref:protein MIZU-KUSSEI 1 n=1 Tax=Impatiens glandulifera TaxID=253017 RepID=UPI001FB17AAA|nr:protein MIZU-KUSSEI 1 [Impatiens glandulifera]